jgi:hypothetical protein
MALGLAAVTREKSTTGRLARPSHGMYFVKQSTRAGALQRCVRLQLGSSLQRPHAGWAYYQCSATETHSCAALAPGALPLREVRAGTTSCWRVSDPQTHRATVASPRWTGHKPALQRSAT